jgi:hypothetical protein
MSRCTSWCRRAAAVLVLIATASAAAQDRGVAPVSVMGQVVRVDADARTLVLGDPVQSPAARPSPDAPDQPGAMRPFKVAGNANITLDGKKVSLKELRPGVHARVHVRMDASRGDSRIDDRDRPRDPQTGNPASITERIEAFSRRPPNPGRPGR